MKKIKREEYEVLKELDDKWKWIARDRDDSLYAFEKKPYKHIRTWLWRGNHDFRIITEAGFQFIQWEDEKPYNIAELIEEYEKYKKVSDYFKVNIKNVNQSMLDDLPTESEETEVKKDLEWLKSEVGKIAVGTSCFYPYHTTINKSDIIHIIDQLDEPEVLSQGWIDEHKVARINNLRKMTMDDVVPVDKLQNLLVPKQELPVIPKFVADWIEEAKGRHHSLYEAMADYCSPEMNQWIQDFYHSDLFAKAWLDGYTVEEEQKYYVLSKELHPMLCESAGTDKKIMESTTQLTINEKRLYKEQYALTEQEIKDYDERFWPFAVKVEELD